MTAIRKSLLQLVFSGAYLLRWNDKLRPVELVELDKQAHKMLTACLLWQENTASLPCERRTAIARRIVEGGIADYLYRLIITDIKPPVFYRIKENPQLYISCLAMLALLGGVAGLAAIPSVGAALGMCALGGWQWFAVIGLTVAPTVVAEYGKLWDYIRSRSAEKTAVTLFALTMFPQVTALCQHCRY